MRLTFSQKFKNLASKFHDKKHELNLLHPRPPMFIGVHTGSSVSLLHLMIRVKSLQSRFQVAKLFGLYQGGTGPDSLHSFASGYQ